MQKIIDGARDVGKFKRQLLVELLRNSSLLLHPFDDPLTLDFKEHRCLRVEREEDYTDWLEWIVCQLKSPESVFELFGIVDEKCLSACRNKELKIKREECVDREKFGLSQGRRLDLPVRYEDTALILVEVKSFPVSPRDPSIRRQLRDQSKWLNQEKVAHTHAIFLVPDFLGEPESIPKDVEGFTPILWADLCAALRVMVSRQRETLSMTALGLILGFVGAVEQNILDFPRCDRVPHNVGVGAWPTLASHLGNVLRLEESYATG